LELTFTNEQLARLCNRRADLAAWAGDGGPALEQLLAELDSVDKLGEVEEFPHVHLLPAPAGRVGADGAEEARVLLKPKLTSPNTYRDAQAATVVAVAAGVEDFNPEGASWPRAFAMSRTTQ
jgi:hypothetical protein